MPPKLFVDRNAPHTVLVSGEWRTWDRTRQVSVFVQGLLKDLTEAGFVKDPDHTLAGYDKFHYLEMIVDGFSCTLAELSQVTALLDPRLTHTRLTPLRPHGVRTH